MTTAVASMTGPLPGWMPDNVQMRARFEQMYAQLARIAHRELGNTPRTSLDTVALVTEAFFKLDGRPLDVRQEGPFLGLAAKAMRQVLIDHVRARMADKRGGGLQAVTLTTQIPLAETTAALDLMDIENGLQALARLDPRLVDVVEMHFFAGMEFAEIAKVLGSSQRTIYRDWQRARAFLQTHLAS